MGGHENEMWYPCLKMSKESTTKTYLKLTQDTTVYKEQKEAKRTKKLWNVYKAYKVWLEKGITEKF